MTLTTAMPPKILAKNPDRQGGVLPVSAATRAGSGKAPAPKLKLEVRRLPPGLTLTEFEETLGEEWKLGSGKVDWREYRQGKTRTPGAGKVPELSRCYIHVSGEAYVREFEKRFLEVVFHDKAGTYKHADLKHLAPTLGFAQNQKTPLQQPRQRADNRQGTIDQDPEFIAFLEAETQPIAKAASVDALHLERESSKMEVKTTPLIEDLREKKANRAKAAQAKAEKAEKDKKEKKAAGKDATTVPEKSTAKGGQQQKVDQAVKDANKAATKQAAAKVAQQQAKNTPPSKTKKQAQSPKPANAALVQPTPSGTSSPAPQRVPTGPRQRGNVEGIKNILHKDLGIRPKPTPAAQIKAASSTTPTTTPNQPETSTTTQTATASPAPSKATAQKPTPPVSSSLESKTPPFKAYLKHANPSQGMTEILIQQALAHYGEMSSVTIDPRKGTAIAVFKDAEGLKKALEAKKVSVANGAVEILEFRERAGTGSGARGGFRGGRGGRGGGRGSQGGSSGTTGAAGG